MSFVLFFCVGYGVGGDVCFDFDVGVGFGFGCGGVRWFLFLVLL